MSYFQTLSLNQKLVEHSVVDNMRFLLHMRDWVDVKFLLIFCCWPIWQPASAAGRKDWSSTDNKALNHSLDSSRHGQYQPPSLPLLVAWDIRQMTTKDLTHRQINSFKRPKELQSKIQIWSILLEATRIARAEFRNEKPKPDTMPILTRFWLFDCSSCFCQVVHHSNPFAVATLKSWLAKFLVCAQLTAVVEPLKWWGTFLFIGLMVWGKLVWTISLISRQQFFVRKNWNDFTTSTARSTPVTRFACL